MSHTLRRGPLSWMLGCLSVVLLVSAHARADADPDPHKFLRFVNDEVHPKLQTSIVSYKNDAGVTVDLIAAVHIADPSYFDKLNTTFKDYDVVLYEMVKPKDMKPAKPGEGVEVKRSAEMNFIHTLQRVMQESLELQFQLDKIDYTAPNFVHADLDSETFLDMQQKRGETMVSLMLQSIIRELSNPKEPAADAPGPMDIIRALGAPDRARQLKLVLARQFADMDSALGAMEGSVIIEERNHQCLKVLKEQIDGGKKHIAIFYGAGHFSSMEKEMIDLMGFKQVGDPRWLTAWDMSPEGQREADQQPAKAPAAQPAPAP